MASKEKYFVEDGKCLTSKVNLLGPHEEVTAKKLGDDNAETAKILEGHVKNGLLYKAEKPRANKADEEKAERNKKIASEAGAVEKLKLANKEIAGLKEKLENAGDDSLKADLKEAKEALKTEKEAHGKTSEELELFEKALEDEKTAHGETSTKLADAETAFGGEVTAHDATKKELKKAKEK